MECARGMLLALIFTLSALPAAAEQLMTTQPIPFANGDFEQGESGWNIVKDRGDCGISTDRFKSGTQSLRIIGDVARKGAKVESGMIACQGPGIVELHGQVCGLSGRHLGLWVREYDAAGNLLPTYKNHWRELGDTGGRWRPLMCEVILDPATVALQLFFLGYPAEDETIEVYVDDLRLVRLQLPVPPWPGTYKLKPDDHERLTAADVIGPDDLVYPDWRQVGVQGGIPEVPVKAAIEDFGGQVNTDIADALERACTAVGEQGGGAILLGEGTYELHRPVTIRAGGVVIRGRHRERTRLVVTDVPATVNEEMQAALFFAGQGIEDEERLLAADGRRGDLALTLVDVGDLQVGEKFNLHAPLSDAFCARIQDRSPRGWNRVNAYQITAINGNRITINQPLRIDFPVADGTYLRRLVPIERSGVEALTIEHLTREPLSSIQFNWGWNCWVRDVHVIKTGRNGVYTTHSKWCEFRNCELDGSWHNDGGQAYAGFTRSWDCLLENCIVRDYRHAPVVQFGAQGCVFRNSTFLGSDAQWHAGWSAENLFENCVVVSRRKHGSYGYGAYATGSNDLTHGPNGPRNVVYNCDFDSQLSGMRLHGVNENWLVLYNRFVAASGPGLQAARGAFDHIVRGNVFVLGDAEAPLLALDTPDCVGIELIDNTLYGGNGVVYAGSPPLAFARGNRTEPAADSAPARPQPAVPSIYAWQQGLGEGGSKD